MVDLAFICSNCGKQAGSYNQSLFHTDMFFHVGASHPSISCDACVHPGISKTYLTGFRWKCGSCHDFDLCTMCYMKDKHNTGHRFVLWTGGKPE